MYMKQIFSASVFGAMIMVLCLATGCLFVFEEEEEDDTLAFGVVIDSSENHLEVTTIEGTVEWNDYTVEVGDILLTTDPGSESDTGDVEIFTDPLDQWDPEIGETYDVEIRDVDDNVIYQVTTIAT